MYDKNNLENYSGSGGAILSRVFVVYIKASSAFRNSLTINRYYFPKYQLFAHEMDTLLCEVEIRFVYYGPGPIPVRISVRNWLEEAVSPITHLKNNRRIKINGLSLETFKQSNARTFILLGCYAAFAGS
jgi:hypothetical protein